MMGAARRAILKRRGFTGGIMLKDEIGTGEE